MMAPSPTLVLKIMLVLINAFWQVALFRQGPEDLPESRLLFGAAAVSYVLVDIFVIAWLYPPEMLVLLLAGDVVLLSGWCKICLEIFKQPKRLKRALTAMFGTGALLQIISLPFSVLPLFESWMALRVLALIIMLLWSIAVYSHILSRAIERSFGLSVVATVIYFILSFELVAYLTPAN